MFDLVSLKERGGNLNALRVRQIVSVLVDKYVTARNGRSTVAISTRGGTCTAVNNDVGVEVR